MILVSSGVDPGRFVMLDLNMLTEIGHERHQRFIETAQEHRRLKQLHRHNSMILLPLIKFIVQLFTQMRSQRLVTDYDVTH